MSGSFGKGPPVAIMESTDPFSFQKGVFIHLDDRSVLFIVRNQLNRQGLGDGVKGRPALKHGIENASQGPEIDSNRQVGCLSSYQFWTRILRCSPRNGGLYIFFFNFYRTGKVGQLQKPLIRAQDILRFNVAMYDIFRVQKL
jgi:hypothetical protein